MGICRGSGPGHAGETHAFLVATLSVDLAYTRYSDIGVALLQDTATGTINAQLIAVPFSGTPTVEALTTWLNTTARANDVRCLLIDGPLGWKSPTSSELHSRHSERALRTPGKTGLPPDGVKPTPYLGFTCFSIALFEMLTARGWVLPGAEDVAHGVARENSRMISETFPTAAWRRLGLASLSGKKRGRDQRVEVAEALRRLQERVDLRVDRTPNHDEIQALVAGVAGVWWERGASARVKWHGEPPFRLDGAWREGYIITPEQPRLLDAILHDPPAVASSILDSQRGLSRRRSVRAAPHAIT